MGFVAIIPARGGSKRFKRKNIAILNDKPLISYPIEAALKSGVFDRVLVTTEDDEIAKIATSCGAEVIMRSDAFATDTAHELDGCLEALDFLKTEYNESPEYFCVAYPTSVLVEADDFIQSCKVVKSANAPCVLMSVSEFNYHPYKTLTENKDGYLEMMFPKQGKERSQTYPHAVASNGTFYWVHNQMLRDNREKSYYQDNLLAYEIPAERAVDIDYAEDLEKVELYLKLKENK